MSDARSDPLILALKREGTRKGPFVRKTDKPLPDAWTAEEEKTLRTLWSEGGSGSEIGKIMGRTRNAIIGKVHRLKLAGRPSTVARNLAAKKPKPKPREPKPKQKSPVDNLPALPVEVPPSVWEPLPFVRSAPLEEVSGCRWPLENGECCNAGLASTRASYCETHTSKALRAA